MKQTIKTITLILCTALPAIYACSQVPPPPPRSQGPGRVPPPPPGTQEPGGRPIQQLLTIKGTVIAWLSNDRNETDGLSLQNSGQTLTVRFAPHMAATLMSAIKTGSSLDVNGFYETGPGGISEFRLVTATAGTRTIYDTPPPVPTNQPAETIEPFNGTITDFRKDAQNMPNGIILSGDKLIELPPGVYDQLQALLKPGAAISGSGVRITPPAGVVLTQNIQTIHPQTLTLNGQTYMVH